MKKNTDPPMGNIPLAIKAAEELDGLKARADDNPGLLKQVVNAADEFLDITPESVMDKQKTPPSGDKHDYMSIAIYTWPNPDTPDGLPYIHKDGEINPEIKDFDLPRQGRTTGRIELLALAGFLTGKTAYADKAVELMRVFFLDDETKMNPHLDYGQGVPGECDGRCYGIIETTRFIGVCNAVLLLEAMDGYVFTDGDAMREWMGAYADWLMTSKIGREEGMTVNNHRVWWNAQVMAYLLFTGRTDEAKALVSKNLPEILEQQMEADGRLPRELARTRSFHYTVFALKPMLHIILAGRRLGLELAGTVNSRGASVKTGIDWLLPYMTGKKEWEWQQIVEEKPAVVFPLLRLAALAFGDDSYEEILKEKAGERYGNLMLDLVFGK